MNPQNPLKKRNRENVLKQWASRDTEKICSSAKNIEQIFSCLHHSPDARPFEGSSKCIKNGSQKFCHEKEPVNIW